MIIQLPKIKSCFGCPFFSDSYCNLAKLLNEDIPKGDPSRKNTYVQNEWRNDTKPKSCSLQDVSLELDKFC